MAEKPQYTLLVCPTIDEIESGLRSWAKQCPDYLRIDSAGKTPEGRDVLLCRITDNNVPDDDKQIALFTCTHGATEKNATTSLLRVIKHLIGDDPTAAAIRKKQIVLVMPCNNPDGFHYCSETRSHENSAQHKARCDVYECWDWNGVTDPQDHPEAVILQEVMEKYQPEVQVDLHGFQYAEQMMWESTGITYSGGYSRSFIPEVPQLMNEAAERAGFLITMGEQSAGRLLATAPVPGADEHFFLRRGTIIASAYAYHRNHTIAMTMELGFEQSALARLFGLLEIGNDVWRGERYPGYPVYQVGCWGSMAVSAWGRTATERRASRVELWRKAGQLSYGIAHPEARGSMMAFFSPDPEAKFRIVSDDREARSSRILNTKLSSLLKKLEAEGGYDTQAIGEFLQTTPAENVAVDGPMTSETSSPTIENGVVLRLLIPYPDVELTHLRLDGHLIAEDDYDGYHVTGKPGTIVEVAIPPGKVRPFHVVTCAYNAAERRSGFHDDDWAL